jgi:hypothetical protein
VRDNQQDRRLDQIEDELETIEENEARIMSDQTQEDAVATQIEADVSRQATYLDEVKTEIARLQGVNPAVDFTAVNVALAKLDTQTGAEQAVAEPAPVVAVPPVVDPPVVA